MENTQAEVGGAAPSPGKCPGEEATGSATELSEEPFLLLPGVCSFLYWNWLPRNPPHIPRLVTFWCHPTPSGHWGDSIVGDEGSWCDAAVALCPQ
jgi:hypothetical protein